MNSLVAPFRDSEIGDIYTKAKKNKKLPLEISGTDGYGRYYAMDCLTGNQLKLIVTYSEDKAKEISEAYRFFDRNILYYPSKDVLFYSADIHGHTILMQRMEVIRAIVDKTASTIVLSIDALLNKVVPVPEIEKYVMQLNKGDEINLEELKNRLISEGYERNYEVDGVGQFSIRGGILDIFPMCSDCPYRIELWGDEVDSIRSFDVESQRSIETVDSLRIFPASEMVLDDDRIKTGLKRIDKEHKAYAKKLKESFKTEEYARINREIAALKEELENFNSAMGIDGYIGMFYDNPVSFLSYLPKDTIILLDDPSKICARGEVCRMEFTESMRDRLEGGYMLPTQAEVVFDYTKIGHELMKMDMVMFSLLGERCDVFVPKQKKEIETRSIPAYHHSMDMLIKDIRNWKKEGYRIILFSPSATRGKRLADELNDREVTCFFTDNKDRVLEAGEMMITDGRLKNGFTVSAIKLVVLTEGDIFGQRKQRLKLKRRQLYSGEKIKSFDDLNIGDYIVHERHGLGIYRGIEKIEVDKVAKDYICIEYSGGSKLYILVSQLDMIQKYSSKEGRRPRLNKLGGSEWEKTKSRVRERVSTIAKELVELYAVRQATEGFAFSDDTVWQREFEEMFPYEETEDQIKAIEETKHDMESTKIMDRLICGDVGYGKTEIAIRAAFKAVQDGKQVAYLVPTTILAQQHYNTFCERMENYPIKIAMMSRFLSPKEQRTIIQNMKKGQVDIVIGTHKLLSKEIDYRNLGLLIIDEEQRFGVSHKEKIKQMKKNVDVLTLTATPIPRTLHMSLIGIRDMSLLEEPPVDRKAIQTYVLEYNPEMVKEAIKRELARGGQVYYVYNRVNTIADIASELSRMMPDVRVAYAHGQMKERELEDVMYAFINKEIDVLVTTTIIETGLDISNVNTMIIHDADNFGLAQLYQLRGRVGRSDRTAYAFLMYKRDKMLRETAEKRLKAIREFTDLGSGYKISMRDLEIRGAGNLLGMDQSGHMEAVGYDLYCKMLNDAILEQKGETKLKDFETSIELPIDAFIPASYVKNEMMKLELYKRISGICSNEDYEDMQEELIDRFGKLPVSVTNLLTVSLVKAKAHEACITSISFKQDAIIIEMVDGVNIDMEALNVFLEKYKGQIKIIAGEKSGFRIDVEKKSVKSFIERLNEIVESISNIIEHKKLPEAD